MKRILFMLVCLALLGQAAAAEDTSLLARGGVSIGLISVETRPGEAELTLSLHNAGEDPCDISVFDARSDQSPASLMRGRADLHLSLDAGEAREETVLIQYDDPDALAASLSLRFSWAGWISGPLTVTLAGGGYAVSAEPPAEALFDTDVAVPAGASGQAVLIQDQLTEQEMAILDYGQARVCLRTENEAGETLFTPIVTIPLDVDASGRATGRYSGLMLRMDGVPDVPFRTVENAPDGPAALTATTISLTGEAIEYAEQTIDIALDGDAARVTAQPVDAWETGGPCDPSPWDLYDQIYISHQMFTLTDAGGGAVSIRERDSLSSRTPLTGPIRLSLSKASDVGDVWVFCEYFFTDQTDVVRPPRPLSEEEPA